VSGKVDCIVQFTSVCLRKWCHRGGLGVAVENNPFRIGLDGNWKPKLASFN